MYIKKVTTYKRGEHEQSTDGGETKRPGGETSWGRNVQGAKRQRGETSINRPPHGVSRQWAVVVRYGMRRATGLYNLWSSPVCLL